MNDYSRRERAGRSTAMICTCHSHALKALTSQRNASVQTAKQCPNGKIRREGHAYHAEIVPNAAVVESGRANQP